VETETVMSFHLYWGEGGGNYLISHGLPWRTCLLRKGEE